MFVKIIRNAETQHSYGTQYWWTGLRDPEDDHIWRWAESKDSFKTQNTYFLKSHHILLLR